jgi:pyroglutamyl-peptidase
VPAGPRLLVTGFGPFPGSAENPTEALMHALRREPPEGFGAAAFRALVLPTDYRRSGALMRGACRRLDPDVVVHFGLSGRAKALLIERLARNSADPEKPDFAGYAPRSGRVARSGPETLATTLSAEAVAAELAAAGLAAAPSDDAGRYVCNATLYRSLRAAPPGRLVGFVHVPPGDRLPFARLCDAARVILRAAACAAAGAG